MCELFGLCSDGASKATRALHSFAEHSHRNPHGWGIAFYRNGELFLQKKPETAIASRDYFRALEDAESDIIVSHVRNASCGELHERNCHPFRRDLGGKPWVFAHNGHVDGVTTHPRSVGETDSETVFHMLMDSVGGAGDAFLGLIEGIGCLFEEYEYGRDIRLNFLLSDGDMLYAFNHHPEKPMYYADQPTAAGNALMVSTQMLGDERWERLQEDRLFAMRDGKITRVSGPL